MNKPVLFESQTFTYTDKDVQVIRETLSLNGERISSTYSALPDHLRKPELIDCVLTLIERVRDGWDPFRQLGEDYNREMLHDIQPVDILACSLATQSDKGDLNAH